LQEKNRERKGNNRYNINCIPIAREEYREEEKLYVGTLIWTKAFTWGNP